MPILNIYMHWYLPYVQATLQWGNYLQDYYLAACTFKLHVP